MSVGGENHAHTVAVQIPVRGVTHDEGRETVHIEREPLIEHRLETAREHRSPGFLRGRHGQIIRSARPVPGIRQAEEITHRRPR